MKKNLVFAAILMCMLTNLSAQSDSTSRDSSYSVPVAPQVVETDYYHQPYHADIVTMDGKMRRGWIYKITGDETIFIPGGKKAVKGWQKPTFLPENSFAIANENIRTMSTHRKNSGLKGALIGLGVGTLTGVIAGFVEGDDEVYTGPINDPFSGIFIAISNAFAMTAGQKALVYGSALGTVGAVAGLLVSTVIKKKIHIGGKKEKVRDLQAEMMRKLALH